MNVVSSLFPKNYFKIVVLLYMINLKIYFTYALVRFICTPYIINMYTVVMLSTLDLISILYYNLVTGIYNIMDRSY